MIDVPVVSSAAALPAGRALRQRLAANPLLVVGGVLVLLLVGAAARAGPGTGALIIAA